MASSRRDESLPAVSSRTEPQRDAAQQQTASTLPNNARGLLRSFTASPRTASASSGYTPDYLSSQGLRTDGEGMSDFDEQLTRPYSGTGRRGTRKGTSDRPLNAATIGRYVEQWPSLAHVFLQEDQEGKKSPRREASRDVGGSSSSESDPMGATRRATRADASTPRPGASRQPSEGSRAPTSAFTGRDDALPTITQEPESTLVTDVDDIPRNEDPLEYSNDAGLSLLDSDSESEDEKEEEPAAPPPQNGSPAHAKATHPAHSIGSTMLSRLASASRLSPFAKTVAKCVLAYFIASLFTYVNPLAKYMASLLPDRDEQDDVTISNMHFIATVAVYFNPGRSIGGMIEANVYAFTGFLYAVSLSLVSMFVAVWLHGHGAAVVSNYAIVVVFIGGGLGLVGYGKIKVNRPTFNTACSLVGVIIFTTIVKEGSSHLGQYSTDYVGQVTLVVVTGVLISNVVCFAVWPRSACTSLQLDIQRNLKSFSTLLKVLTKTFLLDDVEDYNFKSQRLKVAIDNHHTSFVSLKKNLDEARLEAPFDRRLRGRIPSYVNAVDSLNILAQHLGGLRTSCGLQHEILMTSRAQRMQSKSNGGSLSAGATEGDANALLSLKGPDSAFNNYLRSVGPHMRSLVFTSARTLHSLNYAFEASLPHLDSKDARKRNVQSTDSFEVFAKDVRGALRRFQHEQTIAIKRFYTIYANHTLSEFEVPAAKDFKADEDVFLIFYFTFLLDEFARELERLVEALEVIRQDEKAIQETRSKSWWRRILPTPRMTRERNSSQHDEPYWRTLLNLFLPPTPAVVLPSVSKHQANTSNTPAGLTGKQRLNRTIWKVGEVLRAQETKYAIKTGFGCAMLAAPAFIAETRDAFEKYQMQWALISFLVVLSPTVGLSNQLSLHRILGTFAGALGALLIYNLFPDNNIFLPILGAVFSVPCFMYIIGKPQFATTGRFVLLTFNLTALYSYNLRYTGLEVEEVAYIRSVAVVVGVVWATLLNHLLWPIEARRELTRGSSELLFKLAHIYQKLVLAYSSSGPQPKNMAQAARGVNNGSAESEPLLDKRVSQNLSEIQTLELNVQVQLIKLEGLLVQTKHEPRLKGPFPVDSYKKLLGCCQHLLDLLHTMNQVVSRPDWHTKVRRDFIIPLDETGLRKRMVGSVGLFFWLLASAFRLKTPLPPAFPPAEEARQSVLAAIRELPAVKRRAIQGSNEYLLYFAYALSMKDLIHQLEEIGQLAHNLFGVIGGSVGAWEDQFRGSVEDSYAED